MYPIDPVDARGKLCLRHPAIAIRIAGGDEHGGGLGEDRCRRLWRPRGRRRGGNGLEQSESEQHAARHGIRSEASP
jgi:hypothetical protein